ncbi:hypothetical protein [Kibdelosporangium phytohabitans]|uniref:Uncharacterized protein n=1 Tax=Kibdelosporangium phytohabitans TaxID=860235 RepID=A0A0N9IAM0_9PSEU|nr:hypothetical protein [Kibdelosporangium phytohabitans]ALG11821.1 hypothetical protein AOZ06_37515 [Kibdelosporangium phytohabitans]MBE1463235.1 hypothetical protein [Kibdelosporangium phytohabitans]
MVDALATVLTYASLAVALWGVVLVVINRRFALNRPYGLALAGAVLLLELGLLVQMVAGLINVFSTDRTVATGTFIGYLVGPVLIVPLAAVWAAAERSRWGSAVLVIGCLTVPVLILRLRQIWDGHG